MEANSDVIEINDPDENKCLVIRECESIEINDTYKKLPILGFYSTIYQGILYHL